MSVYRSQNEQSNRKRKRKIQELDRSPLNTAAKLRLSIALQERVNRLWNEGDINNNADAVKDYMSKIMEAEEFSRRYGTRLKNADWSFNRAIDDIVSDIKHHVWGDTPPTITKLTNRLTDIIDTSFTEEEFNQLMEEIEGDMGEFEGGMEHPYNDPSFIEEEFDKLVYDFVDDKGRPYEDMDPYDTIEPGEAIDREMDEIIRSGQEEFKEFNDDLERLEPRDLMDELDDIIGREDNAIPEPDDGIGIFTEDEIKNMNGDDLDGIIEYGLDDIIDVGVGDAVEVIADDALEGIAEAGIENELGALASIEESGFAAMEAMEGGPLVVAGLAIGSAGGMLYDKFSNLASESERNIAFGKRKKSTLAVIKHLKTFHKSMNEIMNNEHKADALEATLGEMAFIPQKGLLHGKQMRLVSSSTKTQAAYFKYGPGIIPVLNDMISKSDWVKKSIPLSDQNHAYELLSEQNKNTLESMQHQWSSIFNKENHVKTQWEKDDDELDRAHKKFIGRKQKEFGTDDFNDNEWATWDDVPESAFGWQADSSSGGVPSMSKALIVAGNSWGDFNKKAHDYGYVATMGDNFITRYGDNKFFSDQSASTGYIKSITDNITSNNIELKDKMKNLWNIKHNTSMSGDPVHEGAIVHDVHNKNQQKNNGRHWAPHMDEGFKGNPRDRNNYFNPNIEYNQTRQTRGNTTKTNTEPSVRQIDGTKIKTNPNYHAPVSYIPQKGEQSVRQIDGTKIKTNPNYHAPVSYIPQKGDATTGTNKPDSIHTKEKKPTQTNPNVMIAHDPLHPLLVQPNLRSVPKAVDESLGAVDESAREDHAFETLYAMDLMKTDQSTLAAASKASFYDSLSANQAMY